MNFNTKAPTFLLILYAFLIAIIANYHDNFFDPNYIKNFGDSNFPYIPEYGLGLPLESLWTKFTDFGRPQILPNSVQSDVLFTMVSKIFPYWVYNRLWFVLPTFLIGATGFYCLLTVMKIDNYKNFFLALILITFIIFPPTQNYISLWQLSLAGCLLVLGSFIRILRERHHLYHYLLFALGWMYTLNNLRYTYILILSLIVAIAFIIIHPRFRKKIKFYKVFFAVLFTVVINLSFILPILSYSSGPGPSAVGMATESKTYGKDKHRQYLVSYKENGFYSFDQLIRIKENMKNITPLKRNFYQDFNFLGFLIIVFPLIFILFVKSKTVEIYVLKICLSFQLLILLSLSNDFLFTYFFLNLYDKMPGFFMLNSSHYLVTFISFSMGVGSVLGLQKTLNWFESRKFPRWSSISLLSFFFLVMVFIFSDHLTYKNKQNSHSFSVPEPYKNLASMMKEPGNIVAFPLPTGVYSQYSWHKENDMPDIVMGYAKRTLIGLTNYIKYFHSMREIRKNIYKDELDVNSLYSLNLKYLLLHKDYYPKQQGKLSKIINVFNKEPQIEEIENNEYFNLYEVKKDYSDPIKLIDTKGVEQEIKFHNKTYSSYTFSINETGKYNLKLLQQYHPGWVMSYEGEDNYKVASPIQIGGEKKDIVFNEWSSAELKQNQKVSIYFYHQKAYEVGKLLSLCFFLFLLGTSMFLYLRPQTFKMLWNKPKERLL